MTKHINIRLKLIKGNLIILVGLGLKIGRNQIRPLYASLSIDNKECVSIDYHLQSLTARLFDGQVRVFIILSLKYTKIITFFQITIFFQITTKPENIIKRL